MQRLFSLAKEDSENQIIVHIWICARLSGLRCPNSPGIRFPEAPLKYLRNLLTRYAASYERDRI